MLVWVSMHHLFLEQFGVGEGGNASRGSCSLNFPCSGIMDMVFMQSFMARCCWRGLMTRLESLWDENPCDQAEGQSPCSEGAQDWFGCPQPSPAPIRGCAQQTPSGRILGSSQTRVSGSGVQRSAVSMAHLGWGGRKNPKSAEGRPGQSGAHQGGDGVRGVPAGCQFFEPAGKQRRETKRMWGISWADASW